MAKKIDKNKLKLSGFSRPFFSSSRLSSIVVIILLLASVGFLYAKNQELERKHERQNDYQKPTVSVVEPKTTPTPVPKPKIEGIKTHQLIECKSELCDGGWMSQSECANSTCCQIGNKWIFYKDKPQCIKDQQAFNQEPSPSLVPVVLKSGITVYCKLEGAGAVKDADNTYHEGLQKYESCVNEARRYNSEQLTTCRSFCTDSYNQCFNSCQNALDPNSAYCQSCLTRKMTCFDDCTKTHSDVNLVKSCEAYYSLQKSNLENLKKIYCE